MVNSIFNKNIHVGRQGAFFSMSEWAHPIAIIAGLVYTLGGLAKFIGLKDFYRENVFTPWSEVFPLGMYPDPQIYSYVFGVWEAFSGLILLWPSTWSDHQACFGLFLANLVIIYNGYHTKNTPVFLMGILAAVFFVWLFFTS